MNGKTVLFGLLAILAVCQFQRVDGVLGSLNQANKYVESMYNQLEERIDSSYNKLKDRISTMMLSIVERIDSRVSQALVKIRGVRESCRVPAQLSLANLTNMMKHDLTECVSNNLQQRVDLLGDMGQLLNNKLKESCTGLTTAVRTCIQSDYDALTEFRFSSMGSCKKQIGISIAQQFIDDAKSVQTFVVELLLFTSQAVGTASDCFKQQVVESSVSSIVEAADKCHKRLISNN